MEASEVWTCVRCEAKFCEECGDIKAEICYDCIGWGDEQEDWSEDLKNDHLN
jgi:hypothetical protein